jgi:hypothetical protein
MFHHNHKNQAKINHNSAPALSILDIKQEQPSPEML